MFENEAFWRNGCLWGLFPIFPPHIIMAADDLNSSLISPLSLLTLFLSTFIVYLPFFFLVLFCTQRGCHNSSRVWLDQTIRKRAISGMPTLRIYNSLGFFTSSSFFKCYSAASPLPSSIQTLPLHSFKCLSISRHFHDISNIHGTYVARHLYQLFMLICKREMSTVSLI